MGVGDARRACHAEKPNRYGEDKIPVECGDRVHSKRKKETPGGKGPRGGRQCCPSEGPEKIQCPAKGPAPNYEEPRSGQGRRGPATGGASFRKYD